MGQKNKKETKETEVIAETEDNDLQSTGADQLANDYLVQLQRLQAEFSNYQKRTAKEKQLL